MIIPFLSLSALAQDQGAAESPLRASCKVVETPKGQAALQKVTYYTVWTSDKPLVFTTQTVKKMKVEIFAAFGSSGGVRKLDLNGSITDLKTGMNSNADALSDGSGATGSGFLATVLARKNGDAIGIVCDPWN